MADRGALTLPVLAAARAPLGVYLHVPYCASRCGYCDFNTYVAAELAGSGPSAAPEAYLTAALGELTLAAERLPGAPPVATVFVGGGTPSLLGAAALGRLLAGIEHTLGLAPGAEVTVECNPESTSARFFADLRAAGATRVSIGMQSAVEHVLAVLDRRHSPGRAAAAAAQARAAGFDQVSLDLIYGTPGESEQDWRTSLQVALDAAPTHLSAYALVVEPGTRLARRVAAGELAAPDDDVLADRYEVADEVLSAAGLPWYEVSNWGRPCRHNLGYWTGADWWGIGPGAHSHVGGVRWWNRRHPGGYAAQVGAGRLPVEGFEVLTAAQRGDEEVLLGIRLSSGLPLDRLPAPRVAELLADGLLRAAGERVVLTRRGRLLADAVVRRLLDG